MNSDIKAAQNLKYTSTKRLYYLMTAEVYETKAESENDQESNK